MGVVVKYSPVLLHPELLPRSQEKHRGATGQTGVDTLRLMYLHQSEDLQSTQSCNLNVCAVNQLDIGGRLDVI